jgi:hypothetical protein
MILLKYLVFVLLAGAMFACEDKKNDLQVNLYELLEQNRPIIDSTLTKEQKKVYKKLLKVVVTNLNMNGNRLEFMSKDEFLSEGYPESLYDKFNKDLQDVNVRLSNDTLALRFFLTEFPKHIAKMREEFAKE